ncbi:MAG: OmpA family protein [Thermoanaerobaculia bacterium]|nr:OmpA family protein [Thermoanaerobaculia bacterium]
MPTNSPQATDSPQTLRIRGLGLLAPAALALVVLPTVGCATRGFVRGEVEPAYARTKENEAAIERTQTRVSATEKKNAEQDEQLSGLSKTAREALERAEAAGKLAEGKLLYEAVLTDDDVKFGFDKAELNESARTALDELGQRLVAEDKGVYLEIQGHTDATGDAQYNLKLGEERAENVRRYLNREHKIPLHRIATVSYGETAPVADNATREGRSANRRVVVVVLR